MNQSEFDIAVKSFDLKHYKDIFKKSVSDRDSFVNKFNVQFIKNMGIDDYVSGKYFLNGVETFCYILERRLNSLGHITGATAHKFGIFFKQGINDYVIGAKHWNKGSLDKSFAFLKAELAKLIEAGKIGDLESIRNSKFSPMFKGKILATYFPEDYLSIFSEAHIDYFIHRLDLDDKVKTNADIIDKKEALVQFKESIPEMSRWPLHAFSHFLYTTYPGRPFEGSNEYSIDYIQNVDFIDGDFTSLSDTQKPSKPGKLDYVAQQKSRVQLGERGEYVAMWHEKAKLKRLGIKKKPKQVSLYDDSLGYDIESFNDDGSVLKIEVKATNSEPTDFQFFFTANELSAALMHKEHYCVYIVFKPNSANPKIFNIGNPFIENGKITLIPVSYRIHLKKIDDGVRSH